MLLATRRASRRDSGGNRGSRSLSSTSRARASRSGPVGKSRIGGCSMRIEQHQNFELAFGSAAAGQRQVEISLSPDHVSVALLQCNNRPPDTCQHLPEEDAVRIYRTSGLVFVAAVERAATGDPPGFTVEPRKTPALGAEPADILVRVTPAGELPIENSSEPGAVEHVIAGAEIAVAQHRVDRRQKVRFEPMN